MHVATTPELPPAKRRRGPHSESMERLEAIIRENSERSERAMDMVRSTNMELVTVLRSSEDLHSTQREESKA